MKSTHPGRLHIARPLSNMREDKWVSITITDESNRTHIGEIEVALEDFADAIFGRGEVPCTFDLDTSRVGTVAEVKEVRVFIPYGTRTPDDAHRLVAPLEPDGWHADVNDVTNPNNRAVPVSTRKPVRLDGVTRNVRFRRLVWPDGTPYEHKENEHG